MKNILKGFSTIVLILLVACSSLNYSIDDIIVTGATLPPLPESENVDVILRAVPDYKVQTIGQVRVHGIIDENGMNELKQHVRSKGGNVIALVETGRNARGFQFSVYEIAKRVGKK